MSVWPGIEDRIPKLVSSEGTLLSISVSVEPRYLEEVLDALAQLSFPINPQIYHDAATIYCYTDGRRESEPTTIVEFPAYESWLPEIRHALTAYGFGEDALHAAPMLDDIRSDTQFERAPAGAQYESRVRVKHAHATAAAH